MVDMGVAIILLMKKWVDTHGLTMNHNVSEYTSGMNGMPVYIVCTTSMYILLTPTLEIDVANVTIYSGDF